MTIERAELVTNCDRFENMKHSSVNPIVFTGQGVAMLSTVLRSEKAIQFLMDRIDELHQKNINPKRQ